MKYFFTLCLIISCLSCKDQVVKTTIEVPKEEQKERYFPKLNPENYNVAFLIMDGVYNTELTAPYDIFQHTIFRKEIKAMNVFTVANTLEPITSFEDMRILPDYDYTKDKLPKIDILVVPSAEHHLDSDLDNEEMINFMQKSIRRLNLLPLIAMVPLYLLKQAY